MTDIHRKLLSFIVPVFNEEGNIETCYNAIDSMMVSLSDRYDYELIFTDNHSTDGSFQEMRRIAQQDHRVKILRYSRNFGHQRSVYTGYAHASGDAAVQLDCDLQDPPDLVPEFVALWEQGYKIVYGIRRSRKEGWWINGVRKVFYRVIDLLSEDHLPHDAGDFRLLDRRVREELGKIEDFQPYLRGTIASMGFEQIGVPYDRGERVWGSSKVPIREMLRIAVDGLLNHSVAPLRFATYTGLLVSVGAFCLLIGFLVGKLAFGQNWPAGFATITILILLSITLNALFLGIIGEYLGRIYRQGKRRPMVIIEEEVNIGAGQTEKTQVHD